MGRSTTDSGGLNYTPADASPLAAGGLRPVSDTSDRLTTIHAKTNNGLRSQLFPTPKHFNPFPAGEAFRFLVQDEKKTWKMSLFQFRPSPMSQIISTFSPLRMET